MSLPTKDCYQVKVHAAMTSDLKCLYEKLGTDMFTVKVLTEFADDVFVEGPVPELNPEILEVEFDKCDPCKVTFTVYIELPKGTLNNPVVDINPEDGVEDVRVLPVEHRIRTGGHLHPLEMSVFTVYPLARDTVDEDAQMQSGAVTSSGYETECYSYEQCRVVCKSRNGPCAPPLPRPDSFRVTFPLSQAVACLIPEFGLSGFYLKNLVSTNLKTKVRVVPVNTPGETTVAGLLTYDPERCEACLEVCEEGTYDCIVEGYEYLFVGDAQPSLNEMATNRAYAIRGVSKCTEKDLFVFDVCYKPPLVPLPESGPDSTYMNYAIIGVSDEHWCYEFRNKTPDDVPQLPSPQ